MNNPEVGQKLDPKHLPERDAIHVAILPVIAGEDGLHPGSPIRIKLGTANVALRANYNDPKAPKAPRESEVIGVVDPFLGPWDWLKKGEAFYAFITPGTICGLRHHWEHPSLLDDPQRQQEIEILQRADTGSKEESKKWLMEFADKYNFGFDNMIDIATNPSEPDRWGSSSYLVAMGTDLHGEDDLEPGELSDFWYHLEHYTGKGYDQSHREKLGWSCSC